ncbi:aromatic amino acid exporter YddG [Pseudoxanthomonas putridarboris]|uniref:EamA family transporter n=1 Tax=Pseudoxanthomonas putridarboris TaxID=752605 RepID=A0ABU9J0G9_9GAMM
MGAPRTATWVGLSAILLWSSLAVLTTATEGLPPFQVLAIGFGIAALLGLARTAWRGRTGWRELRQPWPALALTTAALFGYHALYFVALKRAPAVEANLINYLWPLLIVVFAGLLAGVKVRPAQWAGTALGLIAAVLLVTRGQGIEVKAEFVSGYLAALGAALVWSLYSVLNRRFAAVPSAAIAVACAGVAILGGIAHAAFETTVAPTAAQWGVLLLMGIGPVGAAFWLWDHGTKHGDIALLGSLSYLAPLLSTLLLVASGRAQAHWMQAVAIALLLAGAWLSVRAPRAR